MIIYRLFPHESIYSQSCLIRIFIFRIIDTVHPSQANVMIRVRSNSIRLVAF